jgi:predicted enzyme related to lactoylglutathione lyase
VEVEREDGDRWLVLADGDGVRNIGLQRGTQRPGAIHLDLVCEAGEFHDELRRITGLGAQPIAPPRAEPYGQITNLADPDGHPFDLCAYE